jgi:hypothetical protein
MDTSDYNFLMPLKTLKNTSFNGDDRKIHVISSKRYFIIYPKIFLIILKLITMIG